VTVPSWSLSKSLVRSSDASPAGAFFGGAGSAPASADRSTAPLVASAPSDSRNAAHSSAVTSPLLSASAANASSIAT
jgi:anti-sigma factor RsiW